MKIMDILVNDAVILNLGVGSKREVLAEMAGALDKVEPQVEADRLVEVLQEREALLQVTDPLTQVGEPRAGGLDPGFFFERRLRFADRHFGQPGELGFPRRRLGAVDEEPGRRPEDNESEQGDEHQRVLHSRRQRTRAPDRKRRS